VHSIFIFTIKLAKSVLLTNGANMAAAGEFTFFVCVLELLPRGA